MTHLLRTWLALPLIALGVALSAAACGGSDSTAPSTVNVPFSSVDLRVGTGANALIGSTITVNYSGWLYSETAPENKGTLFDSGTLQFTLSAGQVISGWDQGLLNMRVGGLRRLVIPPSLAYGSTANGDIPANSTLVFEVELVSIP